MQVEHHACRQVPGEALQEVAAAQQKLAQVSIGVPVVAITGYDSALARNTALLLGARAYLCKPVDGEALLATIALLLDEAA